MVTGTEEGAALGSQSVVLHGLRSIMVAPLQLEGRLLGVVYLDSRVAKGVFTADDVDILTAITNHVAVALETARAAQLEVAVHAAHRERDLAETLRSAATDLSAALEPTRSSGTLAEITARTLHHDQVLVVAGQPAVGERTGPVISVPPGDRRVEALIAAPGPVVGGAVDAPELLRAEVDAVASWMAVPLRAGDDRTGVLLLASREPAAYSEAQVRDRRRARRTGHDRVRERRAVHPRRAAGHPRRADRRGQPPALLRGRRPASSPSPPTGARRWPP